MGHPKKDKAPLGPSKFIIILVHHHLTPDLIWALVKDVFGRRPQGPNALLCQVARHPGSQKAYMDASVVRSDPINSAQLYVDYPKNITLQPPREIKEEEDDSKPPPLLHTTNIKEITK